MSYDTIKLSLAEVEIVTSEMPKGNDSGFGPGSQKPGSNWEFLHSLKPTLPEQIFNNRLICSVIFGNLNVHDMKVCRLVSKSFNSQITLTSDFIKQCRLELNEDELHAMSREERFAFKNKLASRRWSSLKLQFTNSKSLLNYAVFQEFSEIFSSIVDLSINLKYIKTKKDRKKFKYEKKVDFSTFISTFTSVKNFSMDSQFSQYLIMVTIKAKDIEKIETFFTNLQSFKIESSRSGIDEIKLKSAKNSRRISSLIHSFKNLNLISFEIMTKASSQYIKKMTVLDSFVNVYQHEFFNLTRNSVATITKLSLNFDQFNENDKFNLIFPALKNLKIREMKFMSCIFLGFDDQFRTLGFLQLQPLEQLESFSLEILKITTPILALMKNKLGNLKSLQLKMIEFQDEHNWEFMGLFLSLQSFTIIVPTMTKFRRFEKINGKCENGYITRFINSDLRELSMRGLNLYGFSSLTNGFNLANLVRLSLLKCTRALDDEKLEFICLNLLKLTKLEFTHCPYVTDYGITGLIKYDQGVANSQFSLRNLKKLEELRIISCKDITDFSCQFGIFLPRLRILDLSSGGTLKTSITNTGVKYLLENNPTIEELLLCGTLRYSLTSEVIQLAQRKNVVVKYPDNEWIKGDNEHQME